MDIRDTSVTFPARPYAFYLVRVENVTDITTSPSVEITRQVDGDGGTSDTARSILERRDFRIDRLVFYSSSSQAVTRASRKDVYPVQGFSVKEEDDGSRTVIEVTTLREPLTEFAVATDDRNFHRPVAVQIRGTQIAAPWRTIGRGTLADVSLGPRPKRELTVTLPETREESYRLVIENGDSPPISIKAVRAKGNVYRVRFLTDSDSTYALLFGNPDVEKPKYDLSTVIAGILIVVVLGWALVYGIRRVDALTEE